jgi:citrate lyase beta subunit
MSYKIFQYVPMSKPKALSKMIPKIINANANVILDVEDSVQDTLNPENTNTLKEDARQSIPILISELLKKDIDISKNIYVRVNSFESGELEKDINIISQICERVNSIGIFAPMIKNVEDLYKIKELLAGNFEKVKIVPIIETVEGYKNMINILDKSEKLNIEYIHYGHYDYSLDSEQWPFLEQDELKFWDFINAMIDKIENKNVKYMHTPFGNLKNEKLYKSVIKKLTNICKLDFAVTALNYNQVIYAQDIKVSDIEYNENSVDDKYKLALEVVNIFENNQCSKRSFSVDIKKSRFLTPHEYRMAKKYLENTDNERN